MPRFWIGDQVAVASPAAAGRRLPAELTGIVYAHHPLFAGPNRSTGPAWSRCTAVTCCWVPGA